MALDPSLLNGINGPNDSSQNIFKRRPSVPTIPSPQGIAAPPAPDAASGAAPTFAIPDGGNIDNVGAYRDAAVAGNNQIAQQARTGSGNALDGGARFDPASPLPSAISSISPTLSGALDAPRTLVDKTGNTLMSAGVASPTAQPSSNPASDVASLRQQAAIEPTRAGRDALNSKINTLLGAAVLGGAQPNTPSTAGGITAPPTDAQSSFLSAHGVPASQITNTAIGGDGTADNSVTARQAAIRAGTTPGQNVRLGYDKTSQIYGTSSKPGGPIDTFTGAGIADPNSPSTKIDGAGAVAANQVGLGLTPEAAARSAQYRSDAASGGIASNPRIAADNAEIDRQNAERGAQTDINSIFSEDPRSKYGIAARNARISLANVKGNRTSRYGAGQSPYEQAIQSMVTGVSAPVGGADGAATRSNAYATDSLNQQGETQRQGMKDSSEDARTAAQSAGKLDDYRTDPTTGQVSLIKGGIAQPVTDSSGKAFSLTPQAQKPDIKDVLNSISSGLMINDPNASGGSRKATVNDVPSIMNQFNPQGGPTSKAATQVPQAAIDYLKKNPGTKDHFEQMFGKGTADKYMGNS